jgi:rhamnopyranosyl-N-acetylglucosaminyl-diphospho-decaprenol beta-1,3/1,4-galactofuranosyltransferase
MMTSNTCAIVVTFNRKNLLQRCLSRVATEIEERNILVVDNASTDGTSELVLSTFPNVRVLRLERNVGGAGGFEAGLRWASKRGFSRYWLMDDDGLPCDGCLRQLSKSMEIHNLDIAAPLVECDAPMGSLSFGLDCGSFFATNTAQITSWCGPGGLIFTDANFFNGTLIRDTAINRIGLPDRRLFIRGDEVEYLHRAKEAHLVCATVVAARFIHPSGRDGNHPLLGTRVIVCFTGNLLKDYCQYRNRAYVYKKYRRFHILLLDLVRYPFFFLVRRRLDSPSLLFWAKATLDGLLERFGREAFFLS